MAVLLYCKVLGEGGGRMEMPDNFKDHATVFE
jgi:hypothetical protein